MPRPTAASADESRTKVLYVMGAGRSGSTVLGVALGNCGEMFYAGELDAWLRRSAVPNFEGSERTEFWAAVAEEVDGTPLFGERAWLAMEQSLALLRPRRRRLARALRPRYGAIAEELYGALAHRARASHIVDTSHYPLRARELQRLAGIDLYLIYLVREPQRVTASFNRRDVDQPSKSTLATNAYLWLTHLLAVGVFVRQRRDRRLFLRYEDFLADPAGVLRRVLECVEAESADLPDLSALCTGVAFQGNRLLRSETIGLQAGAPSPGERSRVTALLQRPWDVVFARLGPAAGD